MHTKLPQQPPSLAKGRGLHGFDLEVQKGIFYGNESNWQPAVE